MTYDHNQGFDKERSLPTVQEESSDSKRERSARRIVNRLPPDALDYHLSLKDEKNSLRRVRDEWTDDANKDSSPKLCIRRPDGTTATIVIPDGCYIRPANMPKHWTTLHVAVDFICRMTLASGRQESRMFPGEIVERICRPSATPGQNVFAAELARVVAALGGPLLSPETAAEAIGEIRKAVDQLKMNEVIMPATIEAQLNELADQVVEAREQLTRAHSAAKGPDNKLIWRVATEVLGAVRRQAGMYIPKGYGEGIPNSVHVNELRRTVLAFLDAVIESDGSPSNPDALATAIDDFLKTLKGYNATVQSGIDLVLTGAKLVVALGHGGPANSAKRISGQLPRRATQLLDCIRRCDPRALFPRCSNFDRLHCPIMGAFLILKRSERLRLRRSGHYERGALIRQLNYGCASSY